MFRIIKRIAIKEKTLREKPEETRKLLEGGSLKGAEREKKAGSSKEHEFN